MSGLIPLRIKPDNSVGLVALALTCRLSSRCLPVSVKKVPSTTLGWSCWPHHVTWSLRPPGDHSHISPGHPTVPVVEGKSEVGTELQYSSGSESEERRQIILLPKVGE